MTRKIIALDIRNDRVTALLIKNSLKGNAIEWVFNSPIASIQADTEEPNDGLETVIKKLIGEVDTSGAEFVVSIAPELISYRNLRIPFKDKKKSVRFYHLR